MRILVVEDEPLLADAVADWLRGEAHAVDVAADGEQALHRLDVHEYDVVVLDRDISVVHGDDVCRAVAAGGSEVRVLMLTAAGAISDRVAGLALGADDVVDVDGRLGSGQCLREAGEAAHHLPRLLVPERA